VIGRMSKAADSVRRSLSFARSGARVITPRKISNILLCEWEKFRRVVRPRSRPYVAVLDVSNVCNLHCPFCPTGCRRDSGRSSQFINPDLVRNLLDELADYLVSVNLFDWGEPLLHPNLSDMIALIHERNVLSLASSNLSTRARTAPENLVDAGLDHLAVSVSGATQGVYERYHRGGCLKTVHENISRIIERRRRLGKSTPVIEYKYLAFRHNIQEIDQARAQARRLAVDLFRCVPGGGDEVSVLEPAPKVGQESRSPLCHQLWHVVVLKVDGGIAPCCHLYFREDDLGTYPCQSIMTVRGNDAFATARAFFDPSLAVSLSPELRHPCLKCHMVHGQRHLFDYLRRNPNAVPGHRTGGP